MSTEHSILLRRWINVIDVDSTSCTQWDMWANTTETAHITD